jgi:phosphohistidine phosphatase
MPLTLYLLRHASAEEGSPHFKDHDRNLTSTGIMESARIGKFISEQSPRPEIIYHSDALRAAQTASYVAERLDPKTLMELGEELYSGGAKAYLSLVNQIPDQQKTVLVVGHNPDITYFTEYLCSDDTGGELQKATLIVLEFETESWAEISRKAGKLKLRKDVAELNA